MKIKKTYEQWIDTEYSYHLAKAMEREKTNPVLGYRTAGSGAEFRTGEMLKKEMNRIGLKQVEKNEITVDAWEFHHAVLRYEDENGREHEVQMGAYQTQLVTEGFQNYELVYVGRGTAAEYEGLDVTGKLVLADINQRDEWWINFPVYQAYKKGAVGLIAVQTRGYGEIDSRALNAQDIAGPKDAPAFSISQKDAAALRQQMEKCPGGNHLSVFLNADTRVKEHQKSYNITGYLPGREEGMIVLSAHYDSYFSGFQDDNAAVAMMLGIARALVLSGYQPKHTLAFCAMAAEEWGITDSKYDWSTGAYQQVFHAHADWPGKVIADINFELPAHAHGKQDAIRSTYEYEDFLKHVIEDVPTVPDAYSEGLTILSPIETWSDDFSIAISGIPSMVNDFSGGSFMETHYHSQFDNESYYQEPVYRYHHLLYLKLLLKFDALRLPPMNFVPLFRAMDASISTETCGRTGADENGLRSAIAVALHEAEVLYDAICRRQESGQNVRETESNSRNDCCSQEMACDQEVTAALLALFRKEQDFFVRLNWHDEVLFPQEAVQVNLHHMECASKALQEGAIRRALEEIYGIDNNRYAYQFEESVFSYFTDYVLRQPAERLQWGAGRIVHHENLYPVVSSLIRKLKNGQTDCSTERALLREAEERQRGYYRDDILYMKQCVEKMISEMKNIYQKM